MDSAKKAGVWLLLAFVIFFIFTQPHQLANILTGAVHLLHQGANSVSELIRDL